MVRRHPRRCLSPLIAASFVVLVWAHDLSAQVTYEIVADLASVGGVAPLGGVIRGADGALYGTTSEGGAENCGIVYRLDATGQLSRIHSFSAPDGCRPVGELALGPDGSLYGVTNRGGDSDPQGAAGTIFKIAPDGTFTVLHRFLPPDPEDPEPWLAPDRPAAGLTLAPDGFFYGTARTGIVYRISPDGAFALVHQFSPFDAAEEMGRGALIVAPDGNLYGTTPSFYLLSAITTGVGTVFRVSPGGDADVLRKFYRAFYGGAPPGQRYRADEGAYPTGELAAGPDGEVYGANSYYGPSYETDRGTLFRLDPDGTFRLVHVFSPGADQSYPDGAYPVDGLILATDGHVYGRTALGGAVGNGTIFRISREGEFTALRSFPQDGYTQTGGRLLETSPHVFYGTAGSGTGGVVYRVAVSTSFGVSLVAPIEGDKLFADVPTTIAWSASGAVSIDVELSRHGGRRFEPIAECAGLPGSSTECTWTPTGPPTKRAQIRVIAHDGVGGVASDVSGRFAISQKSPQVRILFPQGAAQLTAYTFHELRWAHNLGPHSAVRIELSYDGGTNWNVLASSVVNLTADFSVFNWYASRPTESALFRVTSLSTGAFDVSNRAFRIVPPPPQSER